MPKPKKPRVSARKVPQQARSNDLVTAILHAAIQVLVKEGAARFTTARVAERAGVSIGSLYQYFPNKASILFRLQHEEWTRTNELLRSILDDTDQSPPERLRKLVHAFIRSECDEAALRIALKDAAPLYRDAPECLAAMAEGEEHFRRFMREALPDAPAAIRDLVGDLIITTMAEVGRDFSETTHTDREIRVFADSMADMFIAYLETLRDS